jgi:hypothetical protein
MNKNAIQPIDDQLIGSTVTSVCSTLADEMLRKSGQALNLAGAGPGKKEPGLGDTACPAR